MEKMTQILSFGHFSLIAARSSPMKNFYSFFPKFLDRKRRNLLEGHVAIDIMDLFLEKVEETTDESSVFHASSRNFELSILYEKINGSFRTKIF